MVANENPSVPTAPPIGPTFEVFGNYILLTKLASGGMAEVFLARPSEAKGNGRVLVIKRILPFVATNPEFLEMFQAEIQTTMAFNHPNTVHLHDFGEVNHQPYIAMEYIEGKNLREVIAQFQKKKETIPIPMVISLISQAAAGLNYAHTFANPVTGEVVNAIHRDISPHNLIISYEGNLKVIDFGIAKAKTGMEEKTRTGTIKGKVGYLSPEQIQGLEVDARVDLFSLAIVAWELLTLRRPFAAEGDSDLTVMKRIELCDQMSAPSAYNASVPPELDVLLKTALKRDPNQRPPTAAAFQADLRQIMRTYYPEYSYSDTGVLLRALFEDEIKAERQGMLELNSLAQKFIMQMTQDSTQVTDTLSLVQNRGMVSGVLSGIRSVVPGISGPAELQLANIEKLAKQKATGRHYAVFAFYIFALVILKLDDHYSWFDSFLPAANSGRPTSAHVTHMSAKSRKIFSAFRSKKNK